MSQEKIKIAQTIVVEGRYDKAKLASFLDANIIETGGFRIYRDLPKRKLLQRLAAESGLILVTDSDTAGFRIRNHLRGCIPESQMIQVYLPDIFGKEKRKEKPSAEGKLGVEGIDKDKILQAFAQAGVFACPEVAQRSPKEQIRKSDFIEMGISGGKDSTQIRAELLKRLDLPERMSSNSLLPVLNKIITKEQLKTLLQQIREER